MKTQIPYKALYPNTHVQGFENVINRLNTEIAEIKDATVEGLVRCSILIRNETEKKSPSTPVDLGNLRSSWFVVTSKKKIANDIWNKSFKNVVGKKENVNATAMRLESDHASAIAEARAKAQTLSEQGKEVVTMGYSAYYAIYVHENMEAHFKRVEPPAGPRWLQNAFERNHDEMIRIIKDFAKKPL
jgi:hypothetical protein